MAGHLSTRIFTAATGPLVRKAAPVVATVAATAVQFVMLAVLAGTLLLGIWWAGNVGTPDVILKTAAVALVLVPLLGALLVVVEQVRITYARPTEAVYADVEVFPDREPM